MITRLTNPPRRARDLQAARAKERAAVAVTERAQTLKVVHQRRRHLPQLRLRIKLQFRHKLLGLEMLERVFAEAASEVVEILRLHLQPRRHLVSTICFEKLPARFQRASEMKPAD